MARGQVNITTRSVDSQNTEPPKTGLWQRQKDMSHTSHTAMSKDKSTSDLHRHCSGVCLVCLSLQPLKSSSDTSHPLWTTTENGTLPGLLSYP